MEATTEGKGAVVKSTYVASTRPRKRKYTRGSVYVVHATGTQFYKIGCSVNLHKRIEQLGENASYHLGLSEDNPVELVTSFRSDDIYTDEEALHIVFNPSRFAGEWFILDNNDLLSIHWIAAQKHFHWIDHIATQEEIADGIPIYEETHDELKPN